MNNINNNENIDIENKPNDNSPGVNKNNLSPHGQSINEYASIKNKIDGNPKGRD